MREKPMSIRAARGAIRDPSKADAVRAELEAVAASEITDVVTWTGGDVPVVQVVASEDLTPRARKAIKKIKVTTRVEAGRDNQPGDTVSTIEIEMHDKLGALRILARTEGLLEGGDDVDKRPTLVGINIRGPVAGDGGEGT